MLFNLLFALMGTSKTLTQLAKPLAPLQCGVHIRNISSVFEENQHVSFLNRSVQQVCRNRVYAVITLDVGCFLFNAVQNVHAVPPLARLRLHRRLLEDAEIMIQEVLTVNSGSNFVRAVFVGGEVRHASEFFGLQLDFHLAAREAADVVVEDGRGG